METPVTRRGIATTEGLGLIGQSGTLVALASYLLSGRGIDVDAILAAAKTAAEIAAVYRHAEIVEIARLTAGIAVLIVSVLPMSRLAAERTDLKRAMLAAGINGDAPPPPARRSRVKKPRQDDAET